MQPLVSGPKVSNTESVFYFDDADSPFYATTPAEDHRCRRLLGHPKANDRTNTVAFEKMFSVEIDHYLSEHAVKGVPCVPAATAIAMFYAAARQHLDGVPLLENIQAHNPILVRDRVETTLVSRACEWGLMLSLQSTVPHFVAEAREADALGVRDSHLTGIGNNEFSTILYPGAAASAESVFHGPTFQVIKHAALNDAGALIAEIHIGDLADIFDLMPIAISHYGSTVLFKRLDS